MPSGAADSADGAREPVRTETKSLEVRQDHQPVKLLDVRGSREVQQGAESRRLPADQTDETAGAAVDVGAQVVVRSEPAPRRSNRSNDLEIDGWATLNRPP